MTPADTPDSTASAARLCGACPSIRTLSTPVSSQRPTTPGLKGAVSVPTVASAEPAAPAAVVAEATYVDTIVPGAKPANLGGTAAALVAKGETTNGSTETAFVPSGKPASVATFR